MIFHWVIAAGVKWVAAKETKEGKGEASSHTKSLNGLTGKLRTRRGETAGRGDPWRDYQLIDPNTSE